MNSQDTTSSNQEKYKIVFLGDVAVGKTSIVQRIINGNFNSKQQETIAIDFVKKNIVHKDKMFRLMFWDTAGQEKYQSLISSYIRDSNCIIFVFDVSCQKTFENCQKWLKIFEQHRNQDASMILVANKVDIVPRIVKKEKSQQWAKKNNLIYCQASAKTGEGITSIMDSIATSIDIQNKSEKSTETGSTLNKKTNVLTLKSGNAGTTKCCYI